MSKQRSTSSKQHSTLLPKTATTSNEFIVKFRPFDKVECCFDIVAVLGNDVASLIWFDFVEKTKFRSTLLPKNCNNVEATFDFVERIVRLAALAFDYVASTLLLVWTGLYSAASVLCGLYLTPTCNDLTCVNFVVKRNRKLLEERLQVHANDQLQL